MYRIKQPFLRSTIKHAVFVYHKIQYSYIVNATCSKTGFIEGFLKPYTDFLICFLTKFAAKGRNLRFYQLHYPRKLCINILVYDGQIRKTSSLIFYTGERKNERLKHRCNE